MSIRVTQRQRQLTEPEPRAALLHDLGEHRATGRRPATLPPMACLCAGWCYPTNVVLASPGPLSRERVRPGKADTAPTAPRAPLRAGPCPAVRDRAGLRGRRLRLLGRRYRALDHGLGDLTHSEPAVHRGLLDPAERLRLGQPMLGLEQALGAVQDLADLEPLAQGPDFGLERGDLTEPADRHLDGRHQVGLGER